MKKENDEITDLFRSRLGNAEMTVRDGFWEELNSEMMVRSHHRKVVFFRVAAAASVLLVLAASSAAFWFFSPKAEIEEAFTQVAVVSGNTTHLDGDVVKQDFTPMRSEPVLGKPAPKRSGVLAQSSGEEDDSPCHSVSLLRLHAGDKIIIRTKVIGKLVEKVGLWQVLLMDPGRTITQLWRTNRGHGL